MVANQILSWQYIFNTVYLAFLIRAQDPYTLCLHVHKVPFRCSAFYAYFTKFLQKQWLLKICAWYLAWSFTCSRKFSKILRTFDSTNFRENFSFTLVNISVKIDRCSEFRNFSNKPSYYWKILYFEENDINYPRSTCPLPPPPPKKKQGGGASTVPHEKVEKEGRGVASRYCMVCYYITMNPLDTGKLFFYSKKVAWYLVKYAKF
jgi:hypothetical protein